ncbi:unnamed protein product [Discosporangium mesarthrocarpum]
MISDGSELLLLVPEVAGVVGSVVLPLLGAVPDGAIVLFSGMGDNAQESLAVGVGALAGSTIMLLTIPWFLALYGGRVDIKDGQAVYKRPPGAVGWTKLSKGGTIFSTGVTGSEQIRQGGYLMLITAFSYLIIQGPAFFLSGTDEEISAGEAGFALTGLVVCALLFVGYLCYQFHLSKSDYPVFEDTLEEKWVQAIKNGEVSLIGIMRDCADSFACAEVSAITALYLVPVFCQSEISPKYKKRLQNVLRPFFDKYDEDESGHLDMDELGAVFSELHQHLTHKDRVTIFEEFDSDKSGHIDFSEFVEGVAKYIEKENNGGKREVTPAAAEETGEADEEEHEELPEDLKDLDADTQQFRIKMRALWMMVLGTALVLIFSDPMVDVLSEVGERTGVSSFYISFVLAPLASNASELIAAFKYSLKKTSKTITISLAALQGAACMNNTFVLGVFMFLIYFRHLAWEFSAETTSILFVEVVMAFVSMREVHRMVDGIFVFALYPLSILIVAGLESIGWD